MGGRGGVLSCNCRAWKRNVRKYRVIRSYRVLLSYRCFPILSLNFHSLIHILLYSFIYSFLRNRPKAVECSANNIRLHERTFEAICRMLQTFLEGNKSNIHNVSRIGASMQANIIYRALKGLDKSHFAYRHLFESIHYRLLRARQKGIRANRNKNCKMVSSNFFQEYCRPSSFQFIMNIKKIKNGSANKTQACLAWCYIYGNSRVLSL